MLGGDFLDYVRPHPTSPRTSLAVESTATLSDGRIRATAEAVAARLRRVMSLHGFQFKSAKRANPVKT